ncbi:uncharacterized protein KGF55_003363 [Candida pseudojiufengensis]|uniref:uncharacterized protein n=1 Tax=Candida pseudojiufengensis TaxID=497109 RepID=UPI002224FD65|nr:uncharacterized protein KGF55_003363 [Candida pseudojiufengensis]KAI5962287.1 hypothetical protein KGF55_003363 [Candida pseudojiufengensis]
MSDFPPNLSIRPLTIEDLDQCVQLEEKGFPEEERCSESKLQYRLTVAPELCSGLFIRDFDYKYNFINLPEVAEELSKQHNNVEYDDDEFEDDYPAKSSVTKETLIGQIIATKIPGDKITEESMEIGNHKESSRHIGIHSVVIDPTWRGKNLGPLLLHDYIQKLSNQDLGDQVVIISHKDLVPFYEKIGFNDIGESDCKFANSTWHDLSIDLIAKDE